jgi:hypothetical protein
MPFNPFTLLSSRLRVSGTSRVGLINLLCMVVLSACGGGNSGTSVVTGNPVGPARAAGCPSALVTAVLACPGGTVITPAELTAIIGTYNNGSDQLFVNTIGTVFYGVSAGFAPVSSCRVGNDVVLSFASSNSITFTISSTAVTANGNVPTSPATPVTNAAQSSCQF